MIDNNDNPNHQIDFLVIKSFISNYWITSVAWVFWNFGNNDQISFGKGHTGGLLVAGMVVLLWLYSAYRLALKTNISSEKSSLNNDMPLPVGTQTTVLIVTSPNAAATQQSLKIAFAITLYLMITHTTHAIKHNLSERIHVPRCLCFFIIRIDLCISVPVVWWHQVDMMRFSQVVDGLGIHSQLWRGELMMKM